MITLTAQVALKFWYRDRHNTQYTIHLGSYKETSGWINRWERLRPGMGWPNYLSHPIRELYKAERRVAQRSQSLNKKKLDEGCERPR